MTVGSLERAALVGLINLIHAVGHHAQGNGILNHDVGGHTHEQVGLSTYPFLAARRLYAFSHIEVIAKVPSKAVVGNGIDREYGLLARIHKCTSLSTGRSKAWKHDCTIIDAGILSLDQTESQTARPTQVGIIGIAQFRASLQISRAATTGGVAQDIDELRNSAGYRLAAFGLRYRSHHVAFQNLTVHGFDVKEGVVIFQCDADGLQCIVVGQQEGFVLWRKDIRYATLLVQIQNLIVVIADQAVLDGHPTSV